MADVQEITQEATPMRQRRVPRPAMDFSEAASA
jgi:hypothetical protein